VDPASSLTGGTNALVGKANKHFDMMFIRQNSRGVGVLASRIPGKPTSTQSAGKWRAAPDWNKARFGADAKGDGQMRPRRHTGSYNGFH